MVPKNIVMGNVIMLGFVAACFLMRPSALGQTYSIFAMFLVSFLLAAYLTVANSNLTSKSSKMYRDMKWLGILVGVYIVYEILISVLFQKSNLELVGKEIGTTFVFVIIYAIYLVNKLNNRRFFSTLTFLVSALGYSAALTFLASQFLGIDSLYLFSISVKGYVTSSDEAFATGAVYFPLTMLYSQFTSGEVQLLRVSGFFREAGIYQAICCYCLAYEIFTRKSTFIIVGLLVGVIAAFSTAGIVVMLAMFGLILLFRGKKSKANILYFFILIITAYPVAVYMPYIGLEAKSYTHSTSISDRSIATAKGINDFIENPLGNGLFSNQKENSGITLLASIGGIGFVGFICQLLILSGWRLNFSSSSQKKMIACFPLLVTALFSQPIAAAPLIYILTMVSFD